MKTSVSQWPKQLGITICAAALLSLCAFAVAQTSPAPSAAANAKPKPAPKSAKQASKESSTAQNATSHIAKRDGDVTEILRILPDGQRQELRTQLAEFEQTHKQDFAVLITYGLKSPKTPMAKSGDSMPEFVQQIAQAWQIGREIEGEGLLMVIALGERSLSIGISPSPTLQPSLAPKVTDEIINAQMAPHLRKGEMALAIKAAVSEIDSKLRAQVGQKPDAQTPTK
ncbi:TPM domain-containing protein [Variovorax sp. PCZ-1]|uniref:TPM domain-containing protein n=1 Tax=Variovorax sp. PCZ-1 TaxID=2835533 RepID=UPI001BD17D36|nr:TPM domain-containing protein [Variovorax sp. PCZ-1]MBS7807421.1 TPM domain-containing protein [Variovorax sp. PCZ-1]